MAVLLALILIGAGVAEFINNERIALIFDPSAHDLSSTARQNILVISFVFIICGLLLLFLP
jgi:hypothetical protein